jgi:hypothetical protein
MRDSVQTEKKKNEIKLRTEYENIAHRNFIYQVVKVFESYLHIPLSSFIILFIILFPVENYMPRKPEQ